MKKLIAILVVFALAMGSVFAEIEISGGTVLGINLMQGKTGSWNSGSPDGEDPAAVSLGANIGFARADGKIIATGGNDTFSGGLRLQTHHYSNSGGSPSHAGHTEYHLYAAWQPIDQLKVTIGNHSFDGAWGTEGVTGWSFYQTLSDFGSMGGGQVWGPDFYNFGIVFQEAFYGGFGGGLYIEIKPMDLLGINVGVRSGNTTWGENFDVVYKRFVLQANLNLDFATINVTFVGDQGDLNVGATQDLAGDFISGTPLKAYLAYAMPIGDSLEFNVGAGIPFPVSKKYHTNGGYCAGLNPGGQDYEASYQAPIAIGAGLKFSTDSFGVKFRAVASLAGKKSFKDLNDNSIDPVNFTLDTPMKFLADVMPYFGVGDNVTVFVSLGVGYTGGKESIGVNSVTGYYEKKTGDSKLGWHVNPMLQIGEEWGSKFVVGVKVWSDGSLDDSWNTKANAALPAAARATKGGTYINFEIPVGIYVSF